MTIAIHTILNGADQKGNEKENENSHELARNFFEQRLIETCARHSYWTQSYYAQAWCHDKPFWQDRSGLKNAGVTASPSEHPLVLALHEQTRQSNNYQPSELRSLASFNPHLPLRIHPATSMVASYCVVDDKVQKQLALHHPNLERPVSYLENQALLPHLDFLWQPQALTSVLKKLEADMGAQNSQRITAWLWQRGVPESMI